MGRASHALATIAREVTVCRRCPELRRYCAEVAERKRRAFADWTYWGRPVPPFGDVSGKARIVIVGLAPGAHGANRTGRMFTGDRSGDFLYAALHEAGLASQPHATARDDGLRLRGVYITAALRCAPPANRPTPAQLERCRPFLVRELDALRPPVTLCLGAVAWRAVASALEALQQPLPRPRVPFGHGREMPAGFTTVLGSYHVSQQNTFTGRLTRPMLRKILVRAGEIAAR